LREPLVDTVELKATVTNPCKFKVSAVLMLGLFLADEPLLQHIDILTAKKEDLTFEAPFELTATRNDCQSSSSPFRENMYIEWFFRYPCFPGVVRYFVRVYAQERKLLYRSPRKIHPLEVRCTLVYRSWHVNLTRGSRQGKLCSTPRIQSSFQRARRSGVDCLVHLIPKTTVIWISRLPTRLTAHTTPAVVKPLSNTRCAWSFPPLALRPRVW